MVELTRSTRLFSAEVSPWRREQIASRKGWSHPAASPPRLALGNVGQEGC